MTDTFDWRAALEALDRSVPDPDRSKAPATAEGRGERMNRQIAALREYKEKVYDLIFRLRDIEEAAPERKRLLKIDADTGHAIRQLEWRRKNFQNRHQRKGVGITIHLTAEEIGILDWIARGLYYGHPIGPDDEPTNYVPSRAQAIRDLIENYKRRQEDRIPLTRLLRRQDEWGAFWIREASWRRASVKRKQFGEVRRPEPPPLTLTLSAASALEKTPDGPRTPA
jgi:hypothetical protein